MDPADAGDLAPEPSDGRPRAVAIWTFAAAGMAVSLAGGYVAFRALRPPPPTPASTPTPQPTPTPNPTPTPLVPRPAARHWLVPGRPWDAWRGRPAPPLTLTTTSGKAIDLGSLRGQRVVIDFWATWCPPCVKTIPELNRLAREGRGRVVVVGITGEPASTVAAFKKRHRIDYHVVAGVENESLPAPFSRVDSLPTLFFVERDGTIRSVVEGYHEYDSLESRFRIGDAAERWARGERDEALKLAAQALEAHLDESTGDDLYAVFGDDPEFAALHDRVTSRITGLLDHYERNHGQHFDSTRAAVVWAIWSLGAEHKDAEAVPHLLRFLREGAIEEVRWRAAEALWQIRDRRAVPDLINALRDPSLKVAGLSASALGSLGERTAVGPLLELFDSLDDNRGEAKGRVAYALGELGDPRAAAPIAASLRSIRDPAYVQWATTAAERLRAAARKKRP